MHQPISRALIVGVLLLGAADAARANTCVDIDESRDTFSPQDRAASLLLIDREFRLEGVQVDSGGCTAFYTLAHIKLGNVIIVTLSGPQGQREGRALGMDDLPSLYNQMVRSMITGHAMSGFNVVDRTNVTKAQTTERRVPADSFTYARLGYGGTYGGGLKAGPAMGFGYRAELDSIAVDVSFLNYQIRSASPSFGQGSGYYGSNGGVSGSLLKLEGLYFLEPAANASGYLGGGLSWGGTSVSTSSGMVYTSSRGSGLQGELTAGYELPRASTLRMFVQADAVLPLYRTTADTGTRKYTPSLTVSVGVGWQHHRK
jgi:hypothetical protein